MLTRIHQALGRLGLLHCRTRVPVLVFIALMAMLTLQRVAVLLYADRARWLDGTDLEQKAKALAVGLRFDVVVTGMLVVALLPIMFLAWPRLVRRPAFKRTVAVVSGGLVGMTAFALMADGFYFVRYGMRLNHRLFEYLPGPGNGYIYALIWEEYPVLGVVAAAGAVGLLVGWLVRRLGFNDRYNVGPFWQAVLWPVLFIGLVVLGIRGTLSSHAINSGPAYFHPSITLSQVTLNGLFTFRRAFDTYLTDRAPLAQMYALLEPDEVDRRVRDLVVTRHDRLVPDGVNPLHRVTDSGRPRRDLNVVVVVLESLNWPYVGHLGGQEGLTPNLDELAANGVYADAAYAVGRRTQRGFAGIFSSFPDVPAGSVTTRPQVAGTFLTLPRLLQRRGYQNLFIYGGPGHRDHRQMYLGSNGVDQFVLEDDLPVRTFRTNLGYNDRDLFQSTIKVLNDLPDDRPFCAILLTLSFHPPFKFPGWQDLPNAHDQSVRRRHAIRFTDRALGQFIDQARQQSWFEHTLFVFVADHADHGYPSYPDANRIPLVFYGPPIEGLQPRRIERVHSQMDVAPTIMGLLGGRYEHCFFGRDMLAPIDMPAIAPLVNDNGRLLFYLSPGAVTIVPPDRGRDSLVHFDPNSGKVRSTGPADPARRDDVVAIVQLAERLFRQEQYRVQERALDGHPNVAAAAPSFERGTWPRSLSHDTTPATAAEGINRRWCQACVSFNRSNPPWGRVKRPPTPIAQAARWLAPIKPAMGCDCSG